MNCYGYDTTVGISCSSLLSVYLFRFQLHLLYIFATIIMVNKDYQKIINTPPLLWRKTALWCLMHQFIHLRMRSVSESSFVS